LARHAALIIGRPPEDTPSELLTEDARLLPDAAGIVHQDVSQPTSSWSATGN